MDHTPAPDPLDEVRNRLEALDDVPLARHPVEFDAIDGLLRTALDGPAGNGPAGNGPVGNGAGADGAAAGAGRNGVPAPPR